ncbi:MAG: hypothetical protein FWE70_03495, partial [Oscillospiraceae bacterium]|nr:hypothetical protein [Oscillospiraceae bacterium]
GEGESGPSGPGPGATPTAGESGENGSPTPTTGGGAPEIEGEYDHGAVLAAWQSGDGSGLSPINAAILEACSDVIASLIKAGMGEYEKELALHDWIIWRAEYDEEANSNAPDAAPDPNNDNPYGLMVKGKAICTGYTLTFQLLMDMVGIECLTVRGFSGSLDHAWNMVRIGGEWYCVDVTWNDPSDVAQTEAMNHKYFNVPGDFMRANFHSWDESAFPKATAPKLYFSG